MPKPGKSSNRRVPAVANPCGSEVQVLTVSLKAALRNIVAIMAVKRPPWKRPTDSPRTNSMMAMSASTWGSGCGSSGLSLGGV